MAEETKETKKIIPESKKKKKRKKKKVLLKVSVVFLLLVVIGWFTFGAKVMKLRSEAKELVAQSSEDTFKASQTSIVYDTNGKQLLKFKGEKDVYYLKYKELPVYVIAAVISVEDRNFYKHRSNHTGWKYPYTAACKDCIFESTENMEEKSKRNFHGSRTGEEIFKRTDFGILFE